MANNKTGPLLARCRANAQSQSRQVIVQRPEDVATAIVALLW